MDSFLESFHHESLSYHLKANGINNENFYADENKVKSLIKDYPHFDEFIQDYEIQRSWVNKQLSNSESANNVLSITPAPTFDNSIEVDSEIIVECNEKNISRGDFDKYFKNSDLFFLLNSTLEGQIILGRYLNTKFIEMPSLKRIVILNEYKEGLDELKLEKEDFLRLSKEIRELFKEIDEDDLYTQYQKIEDTEQGVGQKGSLYHEYKTQRRHLRESGICAPYIPSEKSKNKIKKQGLDSQYSLLNDPDQDKYDFSEILVQWEKTWVFRVQKLVPDKKSFTPISLENYFTSFPCLRTPIAAIELLKFDFKQVVKNLTDNKKIVAKDPSFYLDAFSKNWPSEATKIVEFVKKSSKPALKALVKNYSSVFNDDSLSSTAALIALANCLNVIKFVFGSKQSEEELIVDSAVENIPSNSQIGKKRSKPSDSTETANSSEKEKFYKTQIFQSFILNVKNFSHLNEEKEKFEKLIDTNNLEHHPYVIVCGDWSNISDIYLVINKQLYRCENIVEAIEKCFQCHLRRWPYLCDFIWYFIMKRI